MFSKRHVMTLLLLASLLAACAAPTPTATPVLPAQVQERVSIEFWTIVDGAANPEYMEVVNAFNASQDQYEVMLVTVEDIETAFQTAVAAGGNVPDVIEIWNKNIAPYAEAGALTPLDDFIASSDLNLDQYRPNVIDLTRYNGQIMGLPINFTPFFLNCNQRLIDATLGEGATVPTTLAEFDQWLTDMQVMDGMGNIVSIGWWPNYPDWYPFLYGIYNGGQFFDKAGTPAVTEPEWVEAYEFLHDEFFTEQADPQKLRDFVSGFGDFADPMDPFYTGQVACTVGGEYVYMGLDWFSGNEDVEAAFTGQDLHAYPLPTYDGESIAFVQLSLLSIPGASDAHDGAWAFIRFWQMPETLEQFAVGRQGVILLAEPSPGWISQITNPLVAQYMELLESAKLVTYPYTPAWLRIHDAFDEVMDAALNDRDIEAALQEAAIAALEE